MHLDLCFMPSSEVRSENGAIGDEGPTQVSSSIVRNAPQLSVEAVKQDIRSLSSAFCFLFSPEGTILPVLTTTLCRISGYPEGHLTIQLLQGDLIHCFAFSGFS